MKTFTSTLVLLFIGMQMAISASFSISGTTTGINPLSPYTYIATVTGLPDGAGE